MSQDASNKKGSDTKLKDIQNQLKGKEENLQDMIIQLKNKESQLIEQ